MKPRTSKQKRRQQGYERHPARCINCKHYSPPVYAVPGIHPYKNARCEYGDFATWHDAICDVWTGQNGETVE
jgi:hypothetical protein